MDYPKLYRKRLIPNECIPLKDDFILQYNDDIIFTSWNTLKPRTDFDHGYSCYFQKENIKISKFLCSDGSLCKWYCDIVDFESDSEENALIVIDLLADVIIEPDGSVKVLDLDELTQAYQEHLISIDQLLLSLNAVDRLLKRIYNKQFFDLVDSIFSPYQ